METDRYIAASLTIRWLVSDSSVQKKLPGATEVTIPSGCASFVNRLVKKKVPVSGEAI